MATKSKKAAKARKAVKKKSVEADWITVNEAAEIRGVTKSRVHQWISDGRLTREWRYGRAVVSRSEVLALEHLPKGRPPKG